MISYDLSYASETEADRQCRVPACPDLDKDASTQTEPDISKILEGLPPILHFNGDVPLKMTEFSE